MERLIEWSNEKKVKIAIGNISILREVKLSLIKKSENNGIHPALVDLLINRDYFEDIKIRNPKTIIAVAVPCGESVIAFNNNGKKYYAAVSPNYINRDMIDKKVFSEISLILKKKGNIEQLIFVPMKSIAVKLGLAMYGRNNITYIPEYGSYFRIIVLVSDIENNKPFSTSDINSESMRICDNCFKCVGMCPVAALDKNQSVVDFEKCICRYNVTDKQFPLWIKPEMHNRLFGCMLCQEKCPANLKIDKPSTEIISEFDEKETELILNEFNCENLELVNQTKNKISKLGLPVYYGKNISGFIGRNLKYLFPDMDASGS